MKLGRFNVSKGVVRDLNDLNKLHDLTEATSTGPNIPTFISDLLGGSMNTAYLNTNTFEHDAVVRSVVEISDKSYTERGDAFDSREQVKTHLFKIPSWGITTHIKPSDALRSRVPGTKDQLDNVNRLITNDIRDIRNSMALLKERALVSTIANGSLYVPNGSVQSVDFYSEYTNTDAANRPTVNFDFSDLTAYPREKGEDVRAMIADNLFDGQMFSGIIALCGKEFFRARISHPKEEQAMVDRQGILGQDPLIKRLDGFTNGRAYRKYVGADDILYVEYTARVGGQPLIADDEAYFMPMDAGGLFTEAYAPAETMQYVNTVAQREYVWRYDDEFSGTKLFFESNVGYYLNAPLSIVKGTMTPA